jgi:Tfp pilus assembly protein PilF
MHRKAFTQASPEEARNLFEKAMALEPENHELRYDAGAWYLGQEWTQDAEDLYNLYVVRFPNNPKAWYNLGSAALKNRHSQLARGALERAFELHPLYPPTLSLLGGWNWNRGICPGRKNGSPR